MLHPDEFFVGVFFLIWNDTAREFTKTSIIFGRAVI